MIPYGRQSINVDDIAAVVASLKGQYLTTGPLVEQFEAEIEKIVGAPTVAVSSGTAALHCAYAAIQLKPGDEVITPPITFIATQATAALFGARIVFADIQSDTGNINPAAVEAAITTRTKAIVAVDYAGHPAELMELRKLADKYKIFLIEDAAHSIGSVYRNRPVGSIADITTFSFFPTKNLTTGEGGAISSIHSDLLERAKRFSRQGLIRDNNEFIIRSEGVWHQEVHNFGLNYRLPDVLCALGVSQIARLGEFKQERTALFNSYIETLQMIDKLTLPTKREYVDPMWHLFPLRVDPEIRTQVFNALRAKGVGVQVNYIPAYWHPVFKRLGFKQGMFPESEKFYRSEISIPMYVGIQDSEFEYVVESIRDSITFTN